MVGAAGERTHDGHYKRIHQSAGRQPSCQSEERKLEIPAPELCLGYGRIGLVHTRIPGGRDGQRAIV